MPINLKSKLQIKRGLQEDLGQLDAAELGWCVDTQRLFIGNGSELDGAPVIGNTEILTRAALDHIVTLYGGSSVLGSNSSSANSNGSSSDSSGGVQQTDTLNDNVTTTTHTGVSVAANSTSSGTWTYSITRNNQTRSGKFDFTVVSSSEVDWSDTFSGSSLGIKLTASLTAGVVNLDYTSSNTGFSASLTSSLTSAN